MFLGENFYPFVSLFYEIVTRLNIETVKFQFMKVTYSERRRAEERFRTIVFLSHVFNLRRALTDLSVLATDAEKFSRSLVTFMIVGKKERHVWEQLRLRSMSKNSENLDYTSLFRKIRQHREFLRKCFNNNSFKVFNVDFDVTSKLLAAGN